VSRTDIFDLDSGYKVSRYVDTAAGSGIWATPTIPTGWRIVFHRIGVMNGGDGGSGGNSTTRTRGGGYRQKDVATLPSTVSYIVGNGGVGAAYNGVGGNGGQTSFGNSGDPWYLYGVPDIGVIDSPNGQLVAANTPGGGGGGANGAGQNGQSSAGAAGGRGGTPGNDGGIGADADLNQFEVYGGGGGGGGGGSQYQLSNGGNGGKPGGGGGGGCQYSSAGGAKTGGDGAPGCVVVYTYMLPADQGGTV